MDVDDDSVYELLRSSRERVRQSHELEEDLTTAILYTQQLIRESMALLHDGRDAGILKFHRSARPRASNPPAARA